MTCRLLRKPRTVLLATALLAALGFDAQADSPAVGATSHATADAVTCSAPTAAEPVSAHAARRALEAGQPVREAGEAPPRPIALNGRGYNSGTPPDLDGSLNRLRAEAIGR